VWLIGVSYACWQLTVGQYFVTRAMGTVAQFTATLKLQAGHALRRGTAAIADQPSLPQLYSATGTALRRS